MERRGLAPAAHAGDARDAGQRNSGGTLGDQGIGG